MNGMRQMAVAAVLGFGMEGHMGGWAVISVENPPEYLEAGSTYRIEYAVRQHGSDDELHSGLKGRVVIEPEAGEAMTVPAASGERKGRYVASFRVPEGERVTIRIESGFGPAGYSTLTLMPVAVVRRGGVRPAIALRDRGRELFVAKGCGTCHVNGDVPEFARMNRTIGEIGPDLTGRKLEAAYIRQRLTNPRSLPAIGSGGTRMPNLGLREAEVEALVALISGREQRAGR